MKSYPKNKAGYVNVRDGEKNFVAQIPKNEFCFSQDKTDYEIQFVDGAKWIPVIDLIVSEAGEDEARALLQRMSPDALLIQASKEGNYDLIKWALAEGANIHAQGDRPLYFAVLHEHERCVQLLINRGADPSADGIVRTALRNGNKKILESFSIIEGVSVMDALEKATPTVPDTHEHSAYSSQQAALICPHCQAKGTVTTRRVTEKKGVSGTKAAGAVLTAGWSILLTGLSGQETRTEAHCSNCGSTWHF